MTHLERAKTQADRLDQVGYSHPVYERVALRGILHALLALHEQSASKPRATRTTKETNK